MGVADIRTGRTKANSGKGSPRDWMSPIDRAHPREVIWANISEIFEAGRNVRGCSFVYAIGEENDGPLKIGKAKDPISRLRTMQTGNSRRLKLEFVVMGNFVCERLLQEMFEPFAIRSVPQHPRGSSLRPARRDHLGNRPRYRSADS